MLAGMWGTLSRWGWAVVYLIGTQKTQRIRYLCGLEDGKANFHRWDPEFIQVTGKQKAGLKG